MVPPHPKNKRPIYMDICGAEPNLLLFARCRLQVAAISLLLCRRPSFAGSLRFRFHSQSFLQRPLPLKVHEKPSPSMLYAVYMYVCSVRVFPSVSASKICCFS